MLTRLHRRVAEQAVTDPLTGLSNRRHMAETLEREVDRSLRFGHPISLIILDVDDFKQINDREGHLQGDIVLETVADVVREATRSIDVRRALRRRRARRGPGRDRPRGRR